MNMTSVADESMNEPESLHLYKVTIDNTQDMANGWSLSRPSTVMSA